MAGSIQQAWRIERCPGSSVKCGDESDKSAGNPTIIEGGVVRAYFQAVYENFKRSPLRCGYRQPSVDGPGGLNQSARGGHTFLPAPRLGPPRESRKKLSVASG